MARDDFDVRDDDNADQMNQLEGTMLLNLL
jgi:hypothetical protein